MKGALLAAPSQNLAPHAVVEFHGAAVDPAYPVTNVQTLEPDLPMKLLAAPAVTTKFRVTLQQPVALQGLALINTNLGGLPLVVQNMTTGVTYLRTVPTTRDGLNVNVYWDLRDATTAASVWEIYIPPMTVPIAVGTLLLLAAWTHVRVEWAWQWVDVFPRIEHRTSYGKRLQYWIPVRRRRYTATALDAAQRNVLRALKQEAHGSIVPWTLVPDFEDDTVLLVQFTPEELSETYTIGTGRFPEGTARGRLEMPIEVEEVSNGVGL